MDFSIVIPAKNEEQGLNKLLPKLFDLYPSAEIIVVNDGSSDGTSKLSTGFGAKVIDHPYSKGNGASIKAGTREASGEYIVFMDADGQHDPNDVKRLLDKVGEGYDMVVGARTGFKSQANLARFGANRFYNYFATLMTGHKVEDLTSGMRVVKRRLFKEFLHILPNGFSYPTTITMAFFRAGYSVAYMPIEVEKRIGKSHINLIRDGVRFLLIIFKIATLYSPLKLFFPLSLGFMGMGVSYYTYTFLTSGRFTNMSALLISVSVIIFLMGLISEQITMLIYSKDKY